jgi:hypothetical protein
LRSIRVLKNVITNVVRVAVGGRIASVGTPVPVHAIGHRDRGGRVTAFSGTGTFSRADRGRRPAVVPAAGGR